ncbi:hypothetical protein AB0878_12030 [Amycolatopsis sp. NPDC047767]|uniref:DUF6923 family protein n=1 Tax=Amycolatopsis sp. NPDC047767 TaxID=3156765 RepID=UPI003456CAF3
MRIPRFLPVVAAAVAVSALLVASGWLEPPGRTHPAAPATCPVLQVESQNSHSSSFVRLTLPTGQRQSLGDPGYTINAMAYSASQGVVYGVADGPTSGHFHDGAHAVRIDAAGHVTDLGGVFRAGARHGIWSWATGSTGGAMAGNSWYLLHANSLYTVDVDPASPHYLDVVAHQVLRPVVLSAGVDDFAYNSADGLLYGVSVTAAGHGSVVTINPRDGRVAIVPGLKFPLATAYGSVVFGPDGALYATANRIGHRSVTYRLPRDGSGGAQEISTGPELYTSDAAGCLAGATAPPPPPPPPPPPARLDPPPSSDSVKPSQTAEEPPPSPPVLAEQSPAVPPPPNATSPAPIVASTSVAPPTKFRPVATPQPAVADAGHRVEKQRRWSVAVLVLVIGGGAAAAHVRRGR